MKPYQHYSSDEKEQILASVERIHKMTGYPVRIILSHLGLPASTYYRWHQRASRDSLADRKVTSGHRTWPPIPEEIDLVCSYALEYPQVGYKRLTWQMIDDDIAYLKPYQVYEVLREHNLLRRGMSISSEALKRPPEPDHPDEVWHVDLMYLYIYISIYRYPMVLSCGYYRRLQPLSGELESEPDHGIIYSDHDDSGNS